MLGKNGHASKSKEDFKILNKKIGEVPAVEFQLEMKCSLEIDLVSSTRLLDLSFFVI